MNIKQILTVLLLPLLMTTACTKKDQTPAAAATSVNPAKVGAAPVNGHPAQVALADRIKQMEAHLADMQAKNAPAPTIEGLKRYIEMLKKHQEGKAVSPTDQKAAQELITSRLSARTKELQDQINDLTKKNAPAAQIQGLQHQLDTLRSNLARLQGATQPNGQALAPATGNASGSSPALATGNASGTLPALSNKLPEAKSSSQGEVPAEQVK